METGQPACYFAVNLLADLLQPHSVYLGGEVGGLEVLVAHYDLVLLVDNRGGRALDCRAYAALAVAGVDHSRSNWRHILVSWSQARG